MELKLKWKENESNNKVQCVIPPTMYSHERKEALIIYYVTKATLTRGESVCHPAKPQTQHLPHFGFTLAFPEGSVGKSRADLRKENTSGHK